MLPLTRNIFRQTATSFNNTTKRWKQESYYIQIKWWSFAVCELLKNLHLSINKITTLRSIVTAVVNDLVEKGWRMVHFGGHRFSTYVANDAVFVRISLLFHFKAFFVCNIPVKKALIVTKYAEKTSVFKGEVCTTVDSWVYLLVSVFIFNDVGCVMKTIDIWLMGKWFHPSCIPSLTSELLDLSKTITRRKQQF